MTDVRKLGLQPEVHIEGHPQQYQPSTPGGPKQSANGGQAARNPPRLPWEDFGCCTITLVAGGPDKPAFAPLSHLHFPHDSALAWASATLRSVFAGHVATETDAADSGVISQLIVVVDVTSPDTLSANTAAVTEHLAATPGVVMVAPPAVGPSGTTALLQVVPSAAIMISIFAAFVFSDDSTIKSMGFVLATGVAIDAFVVRMALVPAAMSLLADRAWWLPRWLDRLLPDLDIEGKDLRTDDHAASPAGDLISKGAGA